MGQSGIQGREETLPDDEGGRQTGRREPGHYHHRPRLEARLPNVGKDLVIGLGYLQGGKRGRRMRGIQVKAPD
ncbi:hypothetical protein KSC_069560 [Ktedonobacter sp. SOSP1-52]|nr:hypothetical protein KSC_069560 [Ktedonobacter sp. SOSP1-52]